MLDKGSRDRFQNHLVKNPRHVVRIICNSCRFGMQSATSPPCKFGFWCSRCIPCDMRHGMGWVCIRLPCQDGDAGHMSTAPEPSELGHHGFAYIDCSTKALLALSQTSRAAQPAIKPSVLLA